MVKCELIVEVCSPADTETHASPAHTLSQECVVWMGGGMRVTYHGYHLFFCFRLQEQESKRTKRLMPAA